MPWLALPPAALASFGMSPSVTVSLRPVPVQLGCLYPAVVGQVTAKNALKR